MSTILIATTNAEKIRTARAALKTFGWKVTQQELDISEIQHEVSEVIARDKAQKAFDLVKQPVVVNDDSWLIPGLNGWPGPYMKSMNHWFTPEDFLRLTAPLQDRRVILQQHIVYQDQRGQRYFTVELEGVLLPKVKGAFAKAPHTTIISMTPDGRSVAEVFSRGQAATFAQMPTAWHQLGAWLASGKQKT